jgi:UDP-2-acetamido-2,6-beta-L-arabino-hexul-4-ose reductase
VFGFKFQILSISAFALFIMIILVTGSAGFVGKHLMEALGRRPGVEAVGYDLGTPDSVLEQGLRKADVIFHLAGVNRPQNVEAFKQGNADFTQTLCAKLLALGRTPLFVLSSSIQAELENPYGLSKRQAEKTVEDYAQAVEKQKTENRKQKVEISSQMSDVSQPPTDLRSPISALCPQAVIFRLKNIFGKWCRPNYNSVTATFCHNIAHNLPIAISDPTRELELVYIDDVVAGFLDALEPAPSAGVCERREINKSYTITLGDLAARIRSFRQSRQNLMLPAMDDELTRHLYVTYLSYLDGPDFAYALDQKVDQRGSLAEFLKAPAIGQIFVSRTKPGITRGNHYHHSKTEKFFVVEGEAIIRFRSIQPGGSGQRAEAGGQRTEDSGQKSEVSSQQSDLRPPTSDLCPQIIEHRVSGREFKVVDIPPGYTHSIENVGTGEMVCLFWASEILDPQKPDTYFVPVLAP